MLLDEDIQSEKWITTEQALRYYKIKSVKTLRKYIERGMIVARKMGGLKIDRELTDARMNGTEQIDMIAIAKQLRI